MTYRFPVEFQEIDFETSEKIIQKEILDKKIEEIKSALAYYGNVSFETMKECFKIVKYQSYGFEYVDSELTREYAKEVLKRVFNSFRSSDSEIKFFNQYISVFEESPSGELLPNCILRDKEILHHLFADYKSYYGEYP